MSECLKKATITPQTDQTGQALSEEQKKQGQVVVDFNPETLKYNLSSSTLAGRGKRPAQAVTQSTSRLTMDLVFDTTTTGTDVRLKTHKLVLMMDAAQSNGGGGGIGGASAGGTPSQSGSPAQSTPDEPRPVPAIVVFEWGTIRFEGYLASYSETMELFSKEGIPLRCAVSLSLTQQERTFEPAADSMEAGGIDSQLNLASSAQSMRLGADIGLSMGLSAGVGASASIRGIAELNGIENLRLPGVDNVVVVNGSGAGPAAFSAGAGGGLGAGISGAGGVSAGGSATASAFSGLHVQAGAAAGTPRATVGLSLSAPAGSQIGLGASSNFCTGGAATNQGSGSMSADVGIDANITTGISFKGG